jgi:hypothetical protein
MQLQVVECESEGLIFDRSGGGHEKKSRGKSVALLVPHCWLVGGSSERAVLNPG